jgi:hypothetical protein
MSKATIRSPESFSSLLYIDLFSLLWQNGIVCLYVDRTQSSDRGMQGGKHDTIRGTRGRKLGGPSDL